MAKVMPMPETLDARLDRLAEEVCGERRSRELLEETVRALRFEVNSLRELAGKDTLRDELCDGYSLRQVSARPPPPAPDTSADRGVAAKSPSSELVPVEQGALPPMVSAVFHEDLDANQEIEWQASIWDAAVLMFEPAVGLAGSAMLLLAIFTSCFLQLVFCYIVVSSFIKDGLPTDSDAMKWRLTDAHRQEYMDTGGFVSLAARVCSGDKSLTFSTSQAGLISDINTYRKPAIGSSGDGIISSEGGLLCLVVLMVWLNVVVSDFRMTVDYLQAICSLPTSPETILRQEEGSTVLESVSRCRRTFVVLMAIFRVGVASSMGYAGAAWLCNTIQLTDLILNASALAFVLEIDRMIFSTFVPLRVRSLLGRMEPLKRPRVRGWKGLDFYVVMSFLICVTVTFFVFYGRGQLLYDRLGDIRREVCERGDINFVVQLNEELGFPLLTWTNKYNSSKLTEDDIRLSWFRNAVNEAITLSEKTGKNVSSPDLMFEFTGVVPFEKNAFRSYVQFTVEDFGGQFCSDNLDIFPQLLPYLRDSYGYGSASTCEDFSQHCASPDATQVRFICARTCGCHSVASGLYYLGGCPQVCLEERDKRISAMPCESQDTPELVAAAVAMARSWESHPAEMQEPILSGALSHGCAGAMHALLEASGQEAWRLRYLCRPAPGTATLGPICPDLCECDVGGEAVAGHCPNSCSGQPVSPTACEQGLCLHGGLKANVTLHDMRCSDWDAFMFGRMVTASECPGIRQHVSSCCDPVPGAEQPSCSLCPAPGTTLLPSASLPPDDPYSPGSGCADMDAYVQSDAFCQPGAQTPPEWVAACCESGGA